MLVSLFADALYTERYMGKPTENSDAYKVHIVKSTVFKLRRFGFRCKMLYFLFCRILQSRREQRTSKVLTTCWFMVQQTVRSVFSCFWAIENMWQPNISPVLGNKVKSCTNGHVFAFDESSATWHSITRRFVLLFRQCPLPAGCADLQSFGERASGFRGDGKYCLREVELILALMVLI